MNCDKHQTTGDFRNCKKKRKFYLTKQNQNHGKSILINDLFEFKFSFLTFVEYSLTHLSRFDNDQCLFHFLSFQKIISLNIFIFHSMFRENISFLLSI